MHAQRVIERITYARARVTQCYDLLVMYVIVLHPLDVLRSVIVNQDLQDPEDKMVRDDEHRVGAHG
jgi:hypothetical protein